ncbi:hypothetical protein [Paenibacillus sp. LHD-38]|uniref:hypothetical protein n=1 Tax=Paenibacillus sp. LHD-38 TaxID=3072143 RepID=UPI00280ED582|nr:hypothetical protein [Paenibacillus sp. LHD-38]MDQ8737921.1 hypothetical protein [Paenibacillus sp. LHD-38]
MAVVRSIKMRKATSREWDKVLVIYDIKFLSIDNRGIGLAVVEQKLNLYGGTISVKLVDEKAISFEVSIPLN